jgi:3-dehydrotetronate 4-kinase
MLIGCIADDLTGATDLGVTLAREGLSVTQVNGVPEAALDIPATDAVVVALKSRTNPPEEAVAWSLAALAWLQARGAERIYFKYCSTFDSTPRGNIGPVADALLAALGSDFAVATPAYPRNGRTVYLGHLFVGEALLSESGMRDHPLTPMTDSNLVRVLGAQTEGKVGLLSTADLEAGFDALRARCTQLRGDGVRHAIVDAIRDEHLVTAGQACLDLALTTGGAGLGMGLARALARQGRVAPKDAQSVLPRIDAPGVVLSGSCSQATLGQIDAVRDRYPIFQLDPLKLAQGPDHVAEALAWARSQLGVTPLLISASAPPERVSQARAALGQARAAELVEDAFRRIASALAAAGVRRFVVAGGETSGAVVEALAVKALAIGPEIAPGVPWTAALGAAPCLLALKSGNFGGPDFFARAFEVLG